MPRNVRNVWIDANIEGYQHILSGGPQNKSGGMTLTLKQRDEGCVVDALTISTRVDSKDNIITTVRDNENKVVHEFKTKR